MKDLRGFLIRYYRLQKNFSQEGLCHGICAVSVSYTHLDVYKRQAFIVEKGMPGFTVGQHEKKLGIRGSATSELIFNNVRLGKEHLLGQEGKGFKIAMMTLDGGRIGIAAQALGLAEGALETTIAYVKERKQLDVYKRQA